MTIFHTESGSVYEIGDHAVRRLEGKHDPTPRQGQDGHWREFQTHSIIEIGEPVIFVWAFVEGVAKTTFTTRVTEIKEVDRDNSSV